ncbi:MULTISPECIES: hypothetical protein [unclassified Streptomyces]|uniref:hypothetical protein n=1 Tax=unclassified Streptomyces TaxID=2593676 RepID=UPI0033BCDF1D
MPAAQVPQSGSDACQHVLEFVFFLAGPNIALSGVDPRDAGVASAALTTSQQIGAALGPALLNTLYLTAITGYLGPRAPASGEASRALQLQGFLHGYRITFIVAGALLAAAVLALTVLVKTPKTPADTQPTAPVPTVVRHSSSGPGIRSGRC